MKFDISKHSFNELKHYLGVHLQMGRVQLDSDWNEQSELWLRMQQRHANDTVGLGSPNHGFRVDTRVLLDAMDEPQKWSAANLVDLSANPRSYIDFFLLRTGNGSLAIENATETTKLLDRPVDLRNLREIRFALQVSSPILPEQCRIMLDDGSEQILTPVRVDQQDGWDIYSADTTGLPSSFNLSAIKRYGFRNLDDSIRYVVDYIKIDPGIRHELVTLHSSAGFSATDSGGLTPIISLDDDQRFWGSQSLSVQQATSISYAFSVANDLQIPHRLVIAFRDLSGVAPIYNLTVADDTSPVPVEVMLAVSKVSVQDDWQIRSYEIPQPGIDWSHVKTLRFGGLDATHSYRLAPILIESSLDHDLVIMGGDGTPQGAGRFYCNGLAAIKESHGTYLQQADLPFPNVSVIAEPAAGMCRIDLAYLDMWERPITYIEDGDIREIALEGVDTCTRTQLVTQVRLLAGSDIAPAQVHGLSQAQISAETGARVAQFNQLLEVSDGHLTTKDTPVAQNDPCADPCEPVFNGTFTGTQNRLVRVEIHKGGALSGVDPAQFKWSNENAAVACPLIETALAGANSIKIEKPELFQPNDLLEISDDTAELATGPFAGRTVAACDLRTVIAVNRDTFTVTLDGTALSRDFLQSQHAKVRRWNGVGNVQSSEITLSDGVVIEFGGNLLLTGDYWVFTTRTLNQSVERLVEARPMGNHHHYAKLGIIYRRNGVGGFSGVSVEDLRPVFHPLTGLEAADIAFRPGFCIAKNEEWSNVSNVQQAIDAICRLDLANDVKRHNQMMHGHGVVCGLKLICNHADREQIIIQKGYALDCEGSAIHLQDALPYTLIQQAQNQGLLDAAGNGKLALTIARHADSAALITLEPHTPQDFWESVLEGSLIMDFYEQCIESLILFLGAQFPFTGLTDLPPVPEDQKRLTAFINLLAQLLNSASGPYAFISAAEDVLLRDFYHDLADFIASETFCAMRDDDKPFPDYLVDPGLDTIFGPTLKFHTRMRLHPSGDLISTCGGGNKIYVYDLNAGDMLQTLEFPSSDNVEVYDIAYDSSGNLYAAGVLNNTDSILAVANQSADRKYSWGPASVKCSCKIVTLAMSPDDELYATGRAEGLFRIDGIGTASFTISHLTTFNATGLLILNSNGTRAYMAAATGAIETDTFTQMHEFSLPAGGPPIHIFAVEGDNDEDDMVFHDDTVFITGVGFVAPSGPQVKSLYGYDPSTAVQAFEPVDLGTDTVTRLSVVLGTDAGNFLLAVQSDRYRVVRLQLMPRDALGVLPPPVLDTHFRIPVQLFPIAISVSKTVNRAYVLNVLVNTITAIDITPTFDTGSVPNYTFEPLNVGPPLVTVLSDYREDVMDAYADLLSHFGQYLKDCLVDKFLVDCPQCSADDKVYLGVVEVQANQVYNICNFTKRHYVKSFRTWGYWLSSVPVLPLLKRSFGKFACSILPT